MSIRNIGEQRAKIILTLVASGRITFEIPEDVAKTNKELKQQIDMLKIELATKKNKNIKMR